MLINDYSNQDWIGNSEEIKISVSEVVTAGIIFIMPVIFLLVISAN